METLLHLRHVDGSTAMLSTTIPMVYAVDFQWRFPAQ